MRSPAIFFPLLLVRRLIRRPLREDGSAATLNRLLTSRHVADLQFIFSITLITVVCACVCAVFFEYWHTVSDSWKSDGGPPHGAWAWARLFGDSIASSGPLIGAVLALGCGIIGWAYQSGSARLGIVDLFACEICTLCRVCTIVDLTRRYVQAFHADLDTRKPPDSATIDGIRRAFGHFEASENYTPVFDQNARDLQVLDVKVVTNVTAFYTYMKAMRDALRKLAKTDAPPGAGSEHDAWHEALTSIIYMQFLAFESARKAVRDLIEFEPNEVENTITILVSELYAYSFLLHQFGAAPGGTAGEDFRHARLRLRHDTYRQIVARAYWRAREGEEYWSRREAKAQEAVRRQEAPADAASGSEIARRELHEAAIVLDMAREWRKAAETAKELESRYRLVFEGEAIKRPPDLPRPDPDFLATCEEGDEQRESGEGVEISRRPSHGHDGASRKPKNIEAGARVERVK